MGLLSGLFLCIQQCFMHMISIKYCTEYYCCMRDTACQGKGKFGKLGEEKSCIVVYGSARSSECEAHGPSTTATI